MREKPNGPVRTHILKFLIIYNFECISILDKFKDYIVPHKSYLNDIFILCYSFITFHRLSFMILKISKIIFKILIYFEVTKSCIRTCNNIMLYLKE